MRVFMSSMEKFYEVKRIVRRKLNVKKPFLIEWEGYPEKKDYTWEPHEHLSEFFKKMYCKNGKIKKQFRRMNKKTNVALNRPKRKRETAFPPIPSTVERAARNEAIIPAKRSRGTVEYSEFQSDTGEAILVVKRYLEDKVEYQHFHRISRTVSEQNGPAVPRVEPSVQYV